MGAANEIKAVVGIKSLDNIGAKEITGTAWRHTPAFNVLGVGPEQVTHGSVVRYFHLPRKLGHLNIGESYPQTKSPNLAVNDPDLVKVRDRGREAAMDAKNAIVDERRQAKIVEDLRAVLPHLARPVLFQALVVKTIHLNAGQGQQKKKKKKKIGRAIKQEDGEKRKKTKPA